MGFNIIKLVFKKELKDIFRDRKTLITGVLIPIIIFPLLFTVIGFSMDKSAEQVEQNLTVAIADAGSSALAQFLRTQEQLKLVDSQISRTISKRQDSGGHRDSRRL